MKPMTRQLIDTSNIKDVEAIQVDLWYPRNDGAVPNIIISLMDVRAANDITISYDFDRDGWSIKSNLHDPDNPWWENKTQEEINVLQEKPEVLTEVAFIPSWPLKGVTDET